MNNEVDELSSLGDGPVILKTISPWNQSKWTLKKENTEVLFFFLSWFIQVENMII